VECCALKEDMAMFSAGDLSELGEKGINLSGGQRQRISLARAVYQDAEIYLFDEPLGAVDSSVAKKIFEDCIQNFLKDKTRILITHQLQFLPKVDHIVVMDNGSVKHQGNFTQLMQDGIDLQSLVKAHSGKLTGISEDSSEQVEGDSAETSEKVKEEIPQETPDKKSG